MLRKLNNPFCLPILGGVWLLFSHLLFWVYAPLFDITPDYFDYYSVADRWLKGQFGNYQGVLIDLPLGLPMLLFLKSFLGISTPAYIGMQSIAMVLLYLWLSVVWTRKWGWYGGFAALLLAAYLSDGYSLALFTAPLTEPPFFLLMLPMLSLLPSVLSSTPKPKHSIAFGILLMLLPLFRSNGILLWPWALAILSYLFFVKSKAFKPLLTTLLASGLFLIGLSWLLVGYPNYGNTGRLLALVQGPKTKSMVQNHSDPRPTEKATGPKYLYNLAFDRPSFYYTLLPARIEKHLVNQKLSWTAYRMYDDATLVPEPWRLSLLNEMQEIDKSHQIQNQAKQGRFSAEKSSVLPLKIYHAGYVLHSLVLNHALWLGLAAALLVAAAFKMGGPTTQDALFLWLLALLYLILTLALDFSLSKHLPRYGYLQDFIPYLLVPLGIRLMFKKKLPHAP